MNEPEFWMIMGGLLGLFFMHVFAVTGDAYALLAVTLSAIASTVCLSEAVNRMMEASGR